MDGNIKKINWKYLLVFIFTPIIYSVICFGIGYLIDAREMTAVFLFMSPMVLAVAWYCLASTPLFKSKKKKLEKKLDASGFVSSQTFDGSSCLVVVDAVNGKLALLFRWNPFQPYVVPASRITKTWVDDGKGGVGFMTGSSRVSFLFTIDGVKIRVNTFTSNKRWRMDSDYILTGISKAEMMVDILDEARKRGQ